MAGHDCTMSRTYRVTVGSGSTTTRLQRWRPGSQSKSPTVLQARGGFYSDTEPETFPLATKAE